MSLSDKLQKIREKPHHVRERILIITMAVFVSLVITAWVSNFSFSSFNFKDTGNFINNSKDYLSNSKGYIFDETVPEQFMNSLGSGTSTATSSEISSTSTGISKKVDTNTDNTISTTTETN